MATTNYVKLYTLFIVTIALLLTGSKGCDDNEFQCRDGSCVHKKSRCNFKNECPDHSDEESCPESCNNEMFFNCTSGGDKNCVLKEWRCDRENDCKDKSDELNCTYEACPKDLFTCIFTMNEARKCIPQSWRCDGTIDCDDGTDEMYCPYINSTHKFCSGDQFTCYDGQCINKKWVCDRWDDCADKSDEKQNCSFVNQKKCESFEFQCKDGRCIPGSFLCDKEKDCTGGEDEVEAQCASKHKCKPTEYHCPGMLKCISLWHLCNGINDCIDGSDEGPKCGESQCDQKCDVHCQQQPSGIGRCICEDGFEFNSSCIDINECEHYPNICDQVCNNTIGSYQCGCYTGYTLQKDNKCHYNGSNEPEIIYIDVKILKRFSLTKGEHWELITNLSRGVAVDYDSKSGKLFYTDVTENVIYSSHILKFSKYATETKMIVDTGLAVPDGIAVDWIGKIIYFAESSASRIDVCDYDGEHRAPLISSGLASPRGLALDPRKGLLFITDWGGEAKILRSQMDGSNIKILVTEKVGWPNGITIDYGTETVYWIDARYDYIDSINYDGMDRRTIIKGKQFVPHPFAVTFFGDYLYFTDWVKKGIVRVNRYNSTDYAVVLGNLSRPMDLQVISEERQPSSDNPCDNLYSQTGKKCSHLCVIKNSNESSCLCGARHQLSENGYDCEEVNKFLIFARSWEVRGISLDSEYEHDVMTPILGLSSAVGTDFHARGEFVYFSDVRLNRIGRVDISTDQGSPIEWVIETGLQNPDGIAVDWIGGNLYWTDTRGLGKSTIGISKLDGNFPKIILSSPLGKPRAIVVHPARGYLFYTDWLTPAKIGRADMNGKNYKILVRDGLAWPNGLSIDYQTDKVYWGDAKIDRIECMDLDGNHRTTVIPKTYHSFGLAVDDNYIYWTDWLEKKIQRANKTNFTDISSLRGGYGGLMEIQIYDKSLQKGSMMCSNSKCEQLCIPLPNHKYVCACGTNYTLIHEKECVSSNSTKLKGCSFGEFQCRDGQCINEDWKCDGQKDCKDLSDEDRLICKNKTCESGQVPCKNQRYHQCISPLWRCDGQKDCDDGSDEENCMYNSTSCKIAHNIPCKSGGCVDPTWKCDGYVDCKDGSDEEDCGVSYCSDLNSFQCQSDLASGKQYGNRLGACIPLTWVCDGTPDCIDNSDESNKACHLHRCQNIFEVKLCDNRQCISSNQWCDGVNDCSDWSDEKFCNNRTAINSTDLQQCHPEEFTCKIEHQCISNHSVCDFTVDCNDATDEYNCSYARCQNINQFTCDNQNCILIQHQCDGTDDCGDNSDEKQCDTATKKNTSCTDHQWNCKGTNQCIEFTKVCDSKSDCPNDDDEGPLCKINYCDDRNGGCLQSCYNTPIGAKCACDEGYISVNDTCLDINECLENNGYCSHNCYNLRGSYKCTCEPGYTIRPDRKTCSARGPAPTIMFSDHKEVRQVYLDRGFQNGETLVSNLKSAIGVDFYWEEKRIYWSDVSEDKIERMFLNGTGREEIVNRGMNSPEGLAVDWIAGNIYWTDMRLDTIEAAKTDGSMRSIILSDKIDAPRALAVDPRHGFMFWSDWGKRPLIGRADMDGGNRKVLVTKNIVWPNGITLDLPARMLYFVDARLDILDAIDYDGNNRRTIVRGGKNGMVKHPFACSIFEDTIYFTDWTPGSIRKINKYTGGSKFIFKSRLKKPMDIQVLHPSRQPGHSEIKNHCAESSCSHLCVLKPNGYSCKCPFGLQLKPGDNHSCETIKEVLLYARRQEIRGISLNPNDTLDKILPITGTQNAIGIDFHFEKELIYWTDVSKESISRMKLNGTEREDIYPSGLPAPDGIAIDWIADNMYWTDADTDKIEVARLDGRYRKVLVSTDLLHPRAIVLHPMKGKMLWTDWGKKTIEIATLAGKNRQKLVSRDIVYPNGITISFKDDRVYWCDANRDIIESVFLNGTGRRVVIPSSLNHIKHPFAMATYDKYLYWTDWGKRAIMRYDLETSEVIKMRENYLSLMGLRIYHKDRQPGTNACKSNPCSHLCFAVNETDYHCSCATGYKLNTTDNTTCIGANTFLLYSTTTEVHAIPVSEDSDEESIVPVLGLRSSYAIDFEYKSATIYAVDDHKETIYSVKQDGSQLKPVITSGLEQPQGIAVDWLAGNLYWTDAGTDIIEVSRLDGSHRLVIIDTDLETPRAIVLYPVKGLMFWTDWGKKNPKIERAALDGSKRETIVNGTKMAALSAKITWPNGLTIDYDTDLIYWVDASSDILVQMDLNGENMKILLDSLTHPYAVTVDRTFIYWTDWTGQGIFKIPKAGDRKVLQLRGGIGNIRDVHYYNASRQQGSNPCANNGGCHHLCLATSETEKRCVCTTGRLAEDKVSCNDVNDFLIFAKRNEIQFLDLNPRRRSAPYKSISLLQNVIGIDFHFDNSTIYYSDISKKEIGKIDINGTRITSLITGLKTPDGIAFDWMSGRLYWTDAQENTISRLALNNTKEVLVHEELDEPRAIALSPCDDLMYWTDWGDKPYIRSATMDGYNPKAIIDKDLGWPNGLCVDMIESRIYWADARTDRIESATLMGLDRRIVVPDVPHVFGVTLYGDYLYWTDWVIRAVMRADKHTGKNRVVLKDKLDAQPMDIKIFSKERQNCSRTPCYNKGGCSDICNVKDGARECKCEKKGYKLYNEYRCVKLPVVPECKNLKPNQFLCSDGRACIEQSFLCDGDIDCSDGSDELEIVCAKHVCPANKFACKGTHKCIPDKWVCDSEPDCPDGSDEFDCAMNFTCKEKDFVCDSGQCILKEFKCDDEYDCLDRSDENGCLSRTCRPGFFKCVNSTGCVRNGWLCDGFDDCADGSDEIFANCQNETCSADQFSCATSKGCFPLSWKCDSTADCADGSDELSCNTTSQCQENQQKCADEKVCVDKRFLCDGEEDCFDGSDELNCNHTCAHNTFQCVNTSRCIPLQYQCDGDNDCGDSSDEDVRIGCERSTCNEDQFRCDNLLCIRKEWQCDQDDDCGDMSDERNCACPADKRKCLNGECLKISKFCDGNVDCKDGSDELSCSDACSLRCDNGTCIAEKNICNDVLDCHDESDEKGCNINECDNQHFSQCSQICEDLKQGFKCSCKQGFALQSDQKTCLPNCTDVLVHGCSHYCVLSNSTKHLDYKCKCARGYSLDSNKRSCKHNTNEQPFLLTANKHSLQWLSISGAQKSYEIIRNDLGYAASVDFSWKNKKVYWIDKAKSEINSVSFGLSGTQTSIIHQGLGNPLALAVDWIGENLYFTDDLHHNIFVSKLSGLSRKTLYQDEKMHPLALVCHHQQGYLYYSSKSTNSTYPGSISRVGMDGSNHQVVLNRDIILPMDMTIDLVTETLYWSDLALKLIKYIKLPSFSGTTNSIQTSVLVRRAGEVFGLTTFEDFLYFSTKTPYAINKVHRWKGGNITLVKKGKDMITSMKVVHPLRQTRDVLPCRNMNCQRLCLLSPNGKPSCACPDGFHLSINGKDCVSNCTAGQFQCKNFNCITASWRCDGEWDCTDGSDEVNCAKRKCKRGFYQCLNNQCIKEFHVCDGGNDCQDGSDENEELCQARKCFRFQFQCANHICIHKNQVCDTNDDCGDGSDERNCTREVCPKTRFLCGSGECIPKTWVCDDTDDCADGSDENIDRCEKQSCLGDHFRCNNSRCILKEYKCDGEDDCRDKSDEMNCHNKTCDPNTQRTCGNGNCISKHWHCDGENDCEDGSDEENCPATTCAENHFQCENHNCVLDKWKCDGENDCGDNSDEKNCPANECQNGGLFQCKSTKTCISAKWRCDRHPDCLDFSDEKDCGHLATECHHGNEFQCDNEWQCIPTNWVCDNDTDCFDGSDENREICSTQNFCNSKLKFRCEQSGFCIEKFRQCDGKMDCEDGSDENDCTSPCKPSEFKCSSSGTCIDQLKQCDYYQDCPNNEDEQDCGKKNGGITCSDQCGKKPDVACIQNGTWIKCDCVNNTLLDDNKDCVDIDECRQTPHVCEQQCINVRHSYICRCVNGYELKAGGKCKAKGSSPQLFVPAAGKLIRLSTYEPKKHNKLFTDDIWSHVTSLDFYMRNNRSYRHLLIISDAKKNFSITGISLAESLVLPDISATVNRVRRKSEPQYTIKFRLFDVAADVLKIDYVGGNIFWIDNRPSYQGIFMSDIGGNYTVPILQREVKLEGLALDLENGYMYWSENSYHSQIYKSKLNGDDVTKFVSDRLVHPVSFRVDPASKRLFWADLKKHSIECVHLDGTHRLVIADNMDNIDLAYPFSIDVFEGHIFGVTQRGGKLFKLNKFGPNQPSLIKSDLPKTSQVRIFHENRQLSTNSSFRSPCLQAYCPKLCVVIEQKAICVCQKGTDCQPQACDDNFCHKRGTCRRSEYNENLCRCDEGYHGAQCELHCNDTFCLNGGQCKFNQISQNFFCSCVVGWDGDRCASPTCRNFKCKNTEECRIENGTSVCRVKKEPSTGSSGGTKLITIMAPIVIVVALLIVVIAVILVKRHRQSSQFAPKKIKDIQMQNPLYSYVAFDNDAEPAVGELDKLTYVDEREEANLVVNEY